MLPNATSTESDNKATTPLEDCHHYRSPDDSSSRSSSPARSAFADDDDDVDGRRLQSPISSDNLNVGLRHRIADAAADG